MTQNIILHYSQKYLRRVLSFVLHLCPSHRIQDFILWPLAKRILAFNYQEVVRIKGNLSIKVYGDMEDMVNKSLLFASHYMSLVWEPGTARLVEKLALSSRVVVVAGAHIGYYPLIVKHNNPSTFVYAFEPNPVNSLRCKDNIRLNKFSDVEVLEMALGDKNEDKKMYFDFGQSSFFDSNRSHFGEGVVSIITLDNFFMNKSYPPDLLILDAEGYEKNILDGGENILNNSQPTVIFEVNYSALKSAEIDIACLLDVFIGRGYSLFVIEEENHHLVYDDNFKIRLTPWKGDNVLNRSYFNVLAIIDKEKINQYVYSA